MQGRFRRAELGTAVAGDCLLLGQWEQAERGPAWFVTVGVLFLGKTKKKRQQNVPTKNENMKSNRIIVVAKL